MKRKIVFCLVALFISGCASLPPKESLPAYNINGVTYVPLATLCKLSMIDCEYDTFSKIITLHKNLHRINLMVGQTLVLVDGAAKYLKHRVDVFQGTIVVPAQFKEQLIDIFSKESSPLMKAFSPRGNIKKIVVDAGHGGYDPGTTGRTGLREKTVNLDIANRLSKLLKNEGIEVVMTRSSDTFVSLQRRVDIANKAKADLFVSIHTNANRVRSLNGFEVYYISPNVNDSTRALSAAENVRLELDKNCFDRLTLNLKAILWDMIYTSGRAESLELAQSICRSVNHELNTKILGVKGAGFYVLKGATMPAVLIEIGFLSNNKEERMLKNNYYRQQIAETIAQGISAYAKDRALLEVSK